MKRTGSAGGKGASRGGAAAVPGGGAGAPGSASCAFPARAPEVAFFRALNRVVEPLVRAGYGSPRLVPGGFVVLETRGRKTGRLRRTPLAATRMGRFVIVATFRGRRSQWVRNLDAQPRTRVWIHGQPREARAFVVYPGKRFRAPRSLPGPLQLVARLLAAYTRFGWAFAVLTLEERAAAPRRTRRKGTPRGPRQKRAPRVEPEAARRPGARRAPRRTPRVG